MPWPRGSLSYQPVGYKDPLEAPRAGFKPEFLNRIDETIIFLNLEPDQIGRIVEIQMAHLTDRLAEQNIELVLADSARDLIARQGYDPIYGARPLKRVIQRQIENPLAMEILEGKILEGTRLSAEAEGERNPPVADCWIPGVRARDG